MDVHPFTAELIALSFKHFPDAKTDRAQADELTDRLAIGLGAVIGGTSNNLRYSNTKTREWLEDKVKTLTRTAHKMYTSSFGSVN